MPAPPSPEQAENGQSFDNWIHFFAGAAPYSAAMSIRTLPRRFVGEDRGAVALVFALALVPLMFGIGATVDYSRASLVRADLQSAADGAILAAGRATVDAVQS